jgi:flagellar protein FliS
MMHPGAAAYRTVRNHGVVADASPTRLVQIMFEHVLLELSSAQGSMQRIKGNMPLQEVISKGKAMGKAVRLVNQLNESLDMDKGGAVAENLRALYLYMLSRLTVANATNDPQVVAEVMTLVRTVKLGWDKLVAAGR